MKRFFNNFLLGFLWLSAIALAATFWMNINYGFDMLSAAHWEYLATLQANRSGIKPGFYISLIMALFIGLAGLYLIMRTHIKSNSQKTQLSTQNTPISQPTIQTPSKPTNKEDKNFLSRPVPPISLGTRPTRPNELRPPIVQKQVTQVQPTPQFKTQLQTLPIQPNNSPEIEKALESNEYIIRKCPRIGKLQNPIVAVTYDQTVWIISTKTDQEIMLDAIQILVTIFDDTLGETANDIKLRGFIIEPTNQAQQNNDLIITFDNTADFVKYINEHKNEKPNDYDAELFEAFSTYISTVTGYIGKL